MNKSKIKSILHNCKYGRDGLEEAEETFSRVISGLEKENAELKKQLKDTEEELLSLDRINTDLEEKNIKLKSITEQDIVDVLKKYSEFSTYYDHKIIRGVGFDDIAKAIINLKNKGVMMDKEMGECIQAEGIIGKKFIEYRDKCEEQDKTISQLKARIKELEASRITEEEIVEVLDEDWCEGKRNLIPDFVVRKHRKLAKAILDKIRR
jgi:hypothetical protein